MNGLNLHALARPVVTAVNPDRRVVIRRYAGESVGDDGTPRPRYAPAVAVMAQVQPLPQDKLQYVAQGQQTGIWRQIYLPGDWSGLDRPGGRGGDLVYFQGREWLINPVQEAWGALAGWTLIVVQAQREVPEPEVLPENDATAFPDLRSSEQLRAWSDERGRGQAWPAAHGHEREAEEVKA